MPWKIEWVGRSVSTNAEQARPDDVSYTYRESVCCLMALSKEDNKSIPQPNSMGDKLKIGLKLENVQFSRALRLNFPNLSLNGKNILRFTILTQNTPVQWRQKVKEQILNKFSTIPSNLNLYRSLFQRCILNPNMTHPYFWCKLKFG